MKLDGAWADFDTLGRPKTDQAKRSTLRFEIVDERPQSSVQLSTRPGIVYTPKQSNIASSNYLEIDAGLREDSLVLSKS